MPVPGFAAATSRWNCPSFSCWRLVSALSSNPKEFERESDWSVACCLLLMGLQLLANLRKPGNGSAGSVDRHPFLIGVVLSGANPYFILWWATVGLTLTSQAMEFGFLALVLFALVHWLCDLGWLEVLSFAGFKGSHERRMKGAAVSRTSSTGSRERQPRQPSLR